MTGTEPIFENQLGWLPGPLAGYPPTGAHAAELAGLAALAGVVALAVTARRARARARAGLAVAGLASVAVICVAGTMQLEPVPTAGLNRLAAEMTDPGSVQHCVTASRARYCVYPGFDVDLPSIEAPVNAVLALEPGRPGRQLTVRQVLSVGFTDPVLTYGHSPRQVSEWVAQTRHAPGNVPAASAIYLTLGAWPPAGGQRTDAQFNLALGTAEWAMSFPPTSGPLPCVPLDQAREAIAVWLAIRAARPAASELQSGLPAGDTFTVALVRNTLIPIWNYPGQSAGALTTATAPQLTTAGYLLATATTGLPAQKVSQVVASGWATWLNWHTTDAELAAALGIAMPSVPQPPVRQPPPGARVSTVGEPPQPSPVCR